MKFFQRILILLIISQICLINGKDELRGLALVCKDSNCLSCPNYYNWCTTCYSGYYANSLGDCKKCSDVMIDCYKCTNSYTCTECYSSSSATCTTRSRYCSYDEFWDSFLNMCRSCIAYGWNCSTCTSSSCSTWNYNITNGNLIYVFIFVPIGIVIIVILLIVCCCCCGRRRQTTVVHTQGGVYFGQTNQRDLIPHNHPQNNQTPQYPIANVGQYSGPQPIVTGGSQPMYVGGAQPIYSGGPQPMVGGAQPMYVGGSQPMVTGGTQPTMITNVNPSN
jgi:hypothetical protein